MADAKKYLDLAGLQSYNKKLLVDTVGSIISAYDSTTRTFTLDTYTMPTEGANAGKVVKTPSTPLTLGTAALADVSTAGVELNDTGLVTGGQVYTAIQGITEPMIFKGDVYIVTESTVTKYYHTRTGTSPNYTYSDEITASNAKSGYTYKVITTDNETAGKVGDTLIANVAGDPAALTWTIVPSGDEPSGTVTSIGVSGNGLGTSESNDGAISTSGTINLKLATQSTTSTQSATAKGDTASREYALGVDKDGNLAVNIPWTDTIYTGTGAIDVTGTVISVATAADDTLGVVKAGTNVTIGNAGEINVATATTSAKGVVSVPTTGGLIVGTGDDAGKLSVNVDGAIVTNTSGTISVATASAGNLGVATVAADTSGGLTIASGGVLAVNPVVSTDIDNLFA